MGERRDKVRRERRMDPRTDLRMSQPVCDRWKDCGEKGIDNGGERKYEAPFLCFV